ncbi:hypothetical protein [Winogradskyella helgolandensis]|nr:hypothetical protein [Winogradskyella helgolandensis]
MTLLQDLKNRLLKTRLEAQDDSLLDDFFDSEILETSSVSNEDDLFLFI